MSLWAVRLMSLILITPAPVLRIIGTLFISFSIFSVLAFFNMSQQSFWRHKMTGKKGTFYKLNLLYLLWNVQLTSKIIVNTFFLGFGLRWRSYLYIFLFLFVFLLFLGFLFSKSTTVNTLTAKMTCLIDGIK